MTRLVLVRHGETVWHAENRYAGSTEVALSAGGVAQAERLAQWARGAGLAALYCSTLGRAHATAAIVGRAAALEPRADARLRELHFGEGEGRTPAEMEASFPTAVRAFRMDPSAHPLPRGEAPRAAAERAAECLRGIAAAHPHERVLVVAHTTVNRLVLCQLIGVPLSEYRRVFPSVGNCALTEIRLRDQEASLLEFNTPVDLLPGT